MRQALAGMLWSKQYYYFDLDVWLREHARPPAARARRGAASRNESWFHMVNHDVISMPDKWEYPWYAAWDLAFHSVPLMMVDPDFAKRQLDLMLSQAYLHPTGQIPAYEWNFGDVNPPVHAFATLFLHSVDGEPGRRRRPAVPAGVVHASCCSTSRGGSTARTRRARTSSRAASSASTTSACSTAARRCPTGGRLEQADGTAWMALFSQNMLELALVLAEHDPTTRTSCCKFVEHFFWIAAAVDPHRRPPRRDVGRGGRLLLRRAAAARRHRRSA